MIPTRQKREPWWKFETNTGGNKIWIKHFCNLVLQIEVFSSYWTLWKSWKHFSYLKNILNQGHIPFLWECIYSTFNLNCNYLIFNKWNKTLISIPQSCDVGNTVKVSMSRDIAIVLGHQSCFLLVCTKYFSPCTRPVAPPKLWGTANIREVKTDALPHFSQVTNHPSNLHFVFFIFPLLNFSTPSILMLVASLLASWHD